MSGWRPNVKECAVWTVVCIRNQTFGDIFIRIIQTSRDERGHSEPMDSVIDLNAKINKDWTNARHVD